MIDLKDDRVFEEQLAKCVTSQEISNLTRERAQAMGLAQSDETGRWYPAAGVDEPVRPSSDLVADENFVLGSKLLTLRGTACQRAELKKNLLRNGIDTGKLEKFTSPGGSDGGLSTTK